ncbi:MAG: pyrimidine 5'-nucleotidase [Rhodospirillales bacterium]|jgi:putative hydrolase of the HAD superfamily|nr:pyrimidine 5'-nucleotidase [Rhodospirillales bacterium]MDP6803847.1 pyrimidine 5'-nucleotidase [Rhodospirillales bacterium]
MTRNPPDLARDGAGASRALVATETWIFDLDNTLYPASTNLFDQVDARITEYIAKLLSLDHKEARATQKRYFHEYGTSMRGLMTRHGVDPRPFLDFVHEIDMTVLDPAPELDAALDRLPGRKIIFTNGDTAHAEKVMQRLGVERHFDAIFDIHESDYVPKPQPGPYAKLVARFGISPERAVMIEDLAINLVPAAAIGMTTVWVRTDSEWADDGAADAHVHHVVDDLAGWLAALTADAETA